ncbi:amino acid decarboxylase [Leucobacter sp. UT-8R-CII-1-4]|uniref:aminotransferase class I/II-fold pyridoxal phosphate-dependent enzyme n=1 Tax=Leucobacter sp. UT-8R-CII-1-4 TaxID=3040075 RepID=UPI0024A808BD|nr:aminotransferase class I/II-fold pyridoxal phosphate-dependent enzyme [Leucobacter sp. UT-8R-CII-1-4]MDI6024026.1 amino acid decarboxylase [Leucobacter sp. UT-8R-CII-1-4]
MSRSLTGQRAAPYAEALQAHRDRNGLPFMIPGHSAGQSGGSERLSDFLGERALRLDIPQLVEGIDLGPGNAFSRARTLAAAAWDARTTWFLTNGASQGNRMAVQALRMLGERILVQRSCHSSVYDGLVMSGAEPSYLFPVTDAEHGIAHGVTAAEVERELAEAAAKGDPYSGLVIVSPSYFGVVADIPAIAESCHRHGAALVVDASWGAHFGFHSELPESPTRQGADVVLSSIHKLGGSLTQTAFLHLCEGPFAGKLEPALEAAYRLTESTSLNSLLLASLDIARSELATEGDALAASLAAARELRSLVDRTPGLRIAEPDFLRSAGATEIDPLHVSIDVRGLGVSGPEMKTRLARAAAPVFVEIASPTVIVALIGPRSSPDVSGLVAALVRAGETGAGSNRDSAESELVKRIAAPRPGRGALTPREAYLAPSESVRAAEAVGRVAATMLAAYPPGIPNVVPGEVLTEDTLAYLADISTLPSAYVRGAEDPRFDRVRVLIDQTIS